MVHLMKTYVDLNLAFRAHFHRADATQTQDSYTVLVCHANVIRVRNLIFCKLIKLQIFSFQYFVCRALQFPPGLFFPFSLV